MAGFFTIFAEINSIVNEFIWVKMGLWLLVGTGIFLTILTKFFPISHLHHWWGKTIGGIFNKNSIVRDNPDTKAISQFEAACTSLAATIGTGNIVGVSAAIVLGGPGAVFWMWVAAFFGLMTNFSENVLGIYFRRRNAAGEWTGGPMYYLRDGLGRIKGCKTLGKILAVLFSLFTLLATTGIGNMAQVNKMTVNIKNTFFSSIPDQTVLGNIDLTSLIIGLSLTVICGIFILGGLKRIAAMAEKLVPIIAILYLVGSLAVIITNYERILPMFGAIFRFAFGTRAVAGAATGIAIKTVVTNGCKRGVFSNEAGLGSSVMLHSSAHVKEPVHQGMWGIFEVFIDTFVICTLTALVVLSSGQIDLNTGLALPGTNDVTLVAETFGKAFGKPGEIFVVMALLLFVFTTLLGWSLYGNQAVEYLWGVKAVKIYRTLFTLLMPCGAIMTTSFAWDIADTFNGLMMIPNLIGVLALSPLIVKITRNYVRRAIQGKEEEPLFSYDPKIQREMKG